MFLSLSSDHKASQTARSNASATGMLRNKTEQIQWMAHTFTISSPEVLGRLREDASCAISRAVEFFGTPA
jgi:hypothetical protein